MLQTGRGRSDNLCVHETRAAGGIQAAAFRSRDHRSLRAVAFAVSSELSAIGRDDGRTEFKRRSRHHLTVAPGVSAGTEPPLPNGTSEHQPLVASRRDLLPGRRQVNLFVSGGGFHRRNHRLSPQREA